MAKQAQAAQRSRQKSVDHIGEQAVEATQSAVDFLKDYTRERPEVVALWAFGIGFVLGWKLKPW